MLVREFGEREPDMPIENFSDADARDIKLKVVGFVLQCARMYPGAWGMRECRNGQCVILCSDLPPGGCSDDMGFLAIGDSWGEVYCQLAVTKKLDLLRAALVLFPGEDWSN